MKGLPEIPTGDNIVSMWEVIELEITGKQVKKMKATNFFSELR